MELEQIEMASLIPQRPPFMMVDRILSCDDTDAVTELMVRQDNILLDDSKLSSAGEYGTVVCCQNGLCELTAQQAYQVRLYRRD